MAERDLEGNSLFAQSLRLQEESLRLHKLTDQKLRQTKREILLEILRQIQKKPPTFLTDCIEGQENRLRHLNSVIAKMERLVDAGSG
jgi:hypothetical protein